MNDAMRRQVSEIFAAGVSAADPVRAVEQALTRNPLPDVTGRLVIVSVGKAALGMAQAAKQAHPTAELLVVTNYENASGHEGPGVFAAGHPVPDENGLAASRAVVDLLQGLGEGDHVLALISGGGSALLPAPVDGVSLTDKAKVSELLLASGVDITGMNLVRQNLSILKGGGFAKLAQPAGVTALILSDVIGDDLRVIASGPTVAQIGGPEEAITLLREKGVWDDLPSAVRLHLESTHTHLVADTMASNNLVGSNHISLMAMAKAAPNATVVEEPLIGDVSQAAEHIVAAGRGVTLFGGETTVEIKGDGQGGRNQELALRVAMLAEKAGWPDGWIFLSGGTDGRDGPTDSAGGVVDGGTLERMRAAGVDPAAALANNDSYNALKASGDLLMTGATGTNVADLQVLIRP